MKITASSFLRSFLFVYLIFYLSGCLSLSPVKPTARDAISAPPKHGLMIITGDKFIDLRPGTRINVTLRSGQVLKGKYLGLTPAPLEEYSERYAASREKYQELASLPALGETVVLIATHGQKLEADFYGFDFGVLRIRQTGVTDIGTCYLNILERLVDKEGGEIEPEALRSLMREGKTPFLSAVVLRIKREDSRIALDDVSAIQIRVADPTLKAIGMIFVVAIGVAFFYLLFTDMFKSILDGCGDWFHLRDSIP